MTISNFVGLDREISGSQTLQNLADHGACLMKGTKEIRSVGHKPPARAIAGDNVAVGI
jgi:hypothetical protein